jgi:hypothetical protein
MISVFGRKSNNSILIVVFAAVAWVLKHSGAAKKKALISNEKIKK